MYIGFSLHIRVYKRKYIGNDGCAETPCLCGFADFAFDRYGEILDGYGGFFDSGGIAFDNRGTRFRHMWVRPTLLSTDSG